MSVSPKNVHILAPNADRLPISSARFLPNDKSMRLIIHNFLFHFTFAGLLIPNRLKSFDHRLSCGRIGPFFPIIAWLFTKLFEKLFFLFHKLLLLVLIEDLLHCVAVIRFFRGDSSESNFIWAFTGTLVSLKSWRTFVNTVGRSVDLLPRVGTLLVNIDIIFFFCHILDSTKQENMVLEPDHRMASACLRIDIGLLKVLLWIIFFATY